VLEGVLARGAAGVLSRSRIRSWGLVLAYHNIVAGSGATRGDRSLHLPRARFAEQLDYLARTTEVVPLSAMRDPPGASGKPRVAITFDDAYRGAVTLGVGELARRGIPATIFVAPAFLGGRSFWWDALAGPDGQSGLTAEFRELALERYAGRDSSIRGEAGRHRVVEAYPGPHALTATEEELRAATEAPGITLGSHSWSHPNLARVSREELRRELLEPLDWLRSRFAPVIPWLAYPYGRSSAEVEAAAAAAGYDGALLVAGGWIPAGGPQPFRVPRYNVPAGLSNDGFALRLAGLLAARAG
jgi:peptidoglycan/xylan/chitin deacetylase (PgdA/CDA1 family)